MDKQFEICIKSLLIAHPSELFPDKAKVALTMMHTILSNCFTDFIEFQIIFMSIKIKRNFAR